MRRNLSEYPEELHVQLKRIQAVRKANATRIARLETVGVGVETADARFDFFMDKFVELGILTDEQLCDINEAWQMDLANQLELMEVNVRNRIAEAQRAQQQQLAVPEKGIILPNGQIHR